MTNEEEHFTPVIGRGESLAVGFQNPSIAAAKPPGVDAIGEEGEEGGDDVESPKDLAAERAADIEALKASQGWVFPKVKVRMICN